MNEYHLPHFTHFKHFQMLECIQAKYKEKAGQIEIALNERDKWEQKRIKPNESKNGLLGAQTYHRICLREMNPTKKNVFLKLFI